MVGGQTASGLEGPLAHEVGVNFGITSQIATMALLAVVVLDAQSTLGIPRKRGEVGVEAGKTMVCKKRQVWKFDVYVSRLYSLWMFTLILDHTCWILFVWLWAAP